MDSKDLLVYFLVLIGSLCNFSNAVPFRLFFPFGIGEGDTVLNRTDDYISDGIALKTPIVFYNKKYSTIYVNNDGYVHFDKDLRLSSLKLPVNQPIIAGFLADVDTTSAGTVYYRESQDTALLQRAALDVHGHFADFQDYAPTSLFVATWEDVGFYKGNNSLLNTFQILIASDGINSFAYFHYLANGINWILANQKPSRGAVDLPASAGFDSGDGGNYTILPYSGSSTAFNFATDSNVNVPGVWIYRVGSLKDGVVKGPDMNSGEVVVIFAPETKKDTCLEGAKQCHINAQCIDFTDGFCCECIAPAYGNGYNCLQPGVPQRLNGKLSGQINGIALDSLDMHAYIVTSDGRAYTAISRVPPEIAPNMLTLNTIGGIMGWMFALIMQPRARNGYMYTGGKFNRTATIKFQSGEVAQIRQTFFGHDSLNNMRLETQVDGNVPNFMNGVKITLDDYKEDYRKISPGVIKSRSTRIYRLNDIAKQYTWDQTIEFDECSFDVDKAIEDTMKLSVSRNFVVYDNLNQIVRYAMTNKVSVMSGVDPCRDGNTDCDQFAHCIPTGDTYRCECHSGYVGDGKNCRDIDECVPELNACDKNAVCYNVPGSFQCQCSAGYRGDGRNCQREVRLCGNTTCSDFARCVFNSDIQQPMCECRPGYRGDGTNCSPIEFGCNEVAGMCHEDAECVYDPEDLRYKCECNDGYSGDGLTCEAYNTNVRCNCHVNATCLFDVNKFSYFCLCDPGFTGDGTYCSPIAVADICQRCNVNAQCLFDDNTQDYVCRCSPGYRGDGFQCDALDCRQHQICDSNADCVEDPFINAYRCLCKNGYSGDGYRCEPEGCNVKNDCDVNAQCVTDPRDANMFICMCNANYEGDGKVCTQKVVPCNQVNNCSPYAECLYDPDAESYRCRCGAGFQGDGYRCIARGENCKRDPTVCDPNAACILNVDMYICVCNSNYRGDGKRCVPVRREDTYLLVSQGYSVSRINLDQGDGVGELVVYQSEKLIIGIDSDCADREFYYTDVIEGTINHAKLNGSDSRTIITGLNSPEGVAVDWVSRNLYWTDSELDIIGVSLLNGTYKKHLITTDLVNPRAITVDPQAGKMYWTDWDRSSPVIEVAEMDGSNRKALVDTDLGLPNALTIDYYTKQICWGDAGMKTIECVRADGLGRTKVTSDVTYPFGLVFHGNDLYWTDWKKQGVSQVSRYGVVADEMLSLPAGGNGRLYGITTVLGSCPRVTNACARDNGGCRYLCLPTPNGGRTCACPDDITPDECNEISVSGRK